MVEKERRTFCWWEANHKNEMTTAIGIADREEKGVNIQSLKAEAKLQI